MEEIQNQGFNCIPAAKGPNSVLNGINFVKTFDIYIEETSTNLIQEKRSYSWKLDRNQRPTDEPVKWNDHLLDGERMALYTHLGASGSIFVWFPGQTIVSELIEEEAVA